MAEPLLRMKGISKSFPGVIALKGVDFELARGEVHALVGENGAGKSTLIKILSGVYQADAGEVWLRGRRVLAATTRAMLNEGVSVIYQELALVPYLSVAENIFLGREPRRAGGLIDWKRMNADVEGLLRPFGLDVNPRAKVQSIGPAYQQVVEITKALALKSEILVMDEPTAPLTGTEVERLFETIRALRSSGVSVLYISHRLEEIHQVADRVTVLRDGEHIITAPASSLPVDEIIRYMVGRRLGEQYPKPGPHGEEEVFRVEHLTKKGVCTDVSFSVRRGEVLGFAGLVGAGRTEIMQLVYGYRKRDAGEVYLAGKRTRIRSTKDAVRKGIALIPEERKKEGLVLGLSVLDNASLTVFDLHSLFGFIRWRTITALVRRIVETLELKTPSLAQQVRYLSGGNQQKVVLSKWFVRDCRVYIFDEPTRGIDVGAKVEIYKLMHSLAEQGAAVIMVSSELLEVMNVTHRIAVVYNGRIVKEFEAGETSEEEVMSYALGFESDGAAGTNGSRNGNEGARGRGGPDTDKPRSST